MDSNTWDRIERVFFDVLERPRAERSAFLAEACADDPGLRAEIEAMLSAHDGDDSTGLEIERALLNEERHPTLVESAAHEGQRVGVWRLERPLGQGGMGQVWLASRVEGDFEQQAAVKLVRPGWRTAELARRFRRERQLLARLTHPNIATLLDGGVTPDGLPFLVLEYVDGAPITAWCAAMRLDVRARLRLFLEVCDAVRFAHANLVVHRDLKPANILVTRDGRPVLLDFGIAKLLDPGDEGAATRPDERLLTPEHAAPEQLRGDPATVATDVWALGALLFEMLAGKRPFDVGGKSASSIERLVCGTDPPRPSALAPPADARALRGDLDAIVRAAMHREPERRYRSVEQLAEDVERYLTGMPVRAQADSWPYRARKFARRHRAALAAATAFVAVLGASAVSWWHQARVVARERDRAIGANQDSQQAVSMLVNLFSVANPRVTPGGDSLRVMDVLHVMEDRLERSGESPRVRARLWSVLADIHTARASYAEAESAAIRGVAIAGQAGLEAETLVLAHQRARLVEYGGAPAAAEPLYRESLRRHEALYGPHDKELVPVLQDLAGVLDDPDEAGALLDRAVGIAGQGSDASTLAALHNARGSNYFRASRAADAAAAYRLALDALVATADASEADLLAVRSNLAVCQGSLGRFAEAEESHRAIVEGRRRVFGDRSLPVGSSLVQLGVVVAMQGRFEESARALADGVEIMTEVVGADHPETLLARRSYASVLFRAGRAEEGAAMYDDVVRYYRDTFGDDSDDVARLRLGRIEADLVRGVSAPHDTVQALAARAAPASPKARLDVARAVGLSALLSADRAASTAAAPALEEAVAIARTVYSPAHPEIAFLETALAVARRDSGAPVDRQALRRSVDACGSWGLGNPRVIARAREVLARAEP